MCIGVHIPWMIWITDIQNSINDINECALPLCEGSHTLTVVCHSGRVVIESYEEEGQAGCGSGGVIISENNTKLPVEYRVVMIMNWSVVPCKGKSLRQSI